jgi:hypothetical protein
VARGDLLLQRLDGRLFELGDRPALDADQVIVVVVVVGDLVPRHAVAEAPLVGHAALGEQLERAVHRRVPHARIEGAHLRQQLVDRDVGRRLEERLDDDPPLLGRAQPLLHHVGREQASQVREMILLERLRHAPRARLARAAVGSSLHAAWG